MSRQSTRAFGAIPAHTTPRWLLRPCTQAIQFDPSYVEAYNNSGLSYEALDRRAKAIADFCKAQSTDSTDRVSKQQLRMLGF
jgi:Flp pilus assembly protein TadD